MFEDLFEKMEDKLRENGEEIDPESIIDLLSTKILKERREQDKENTAQLIFENDDFIRRNRLRWEDGLTKLHSLRATCLFAGMNFQQQHNKIPKYENDVLIGVLMRQHARACRISGEIIHLLEGGYPDAALSLWRTLHEIVITCLLIKQFGREAAIDYINYGNVKTIEGMQELRKCSEEMGEDTSYLLDEEDYLKIKETITGGNKSWHWARKYTNNLAQIGKLREFVGLGKWSHIYKLASRNIHADYHEMAGLLGMREAKGDMLLSGQSSSGLSLPAHCMAIALAQITSVYLGCYIEDVDSDINYTDSLIFMKIIDNYVKDVGESFSNVKEDTSCLI